MNNEPNDEIPKFSDAVENFKKFLGSESKPTELCWVFRDDFYQTDYKTFCLKFPLLNDRGELAKKAFENGRKENLVRVDALCSIESYAISTIWYPITELDRPQGWDHGIKLCINSYFGPGKRIKSDFHWNIIKLSFAYRRYQKYDSFYLDSKKIA